MHIHLATLTCSLTNKTKLPLPIVSPINYNSLLLATLLWLITFFFCPNLYTQYAVTIEYRAT